VESAAAVGQCAAGEDRKMARKTLVFAAIRATGGLAQFVKDVLG
jgi:hypothetical protein